ncbi:MAG: hypothetical protein M1834_008947 [Cirrosporium novae-zelandiae]|nr:MAG: hypothetical protein M1834_008947 [Cirrosporium novae-zelandiae]
MYGEQNDGRRDSRPLSFSASSLDVDDTSQQYYDPSPDSPPRNPLFRAISNDHINPHVNGDGRITPTKNNSRGRENSNRPQSPTISLHERSPSETANSQFPLTDIDYESNPAAVAQELSNLQALRRMSMDVNAVGDPDLPSFNNFMPTISPSASADDDDPSRLFWVPARLHPELAPDSFKSFIESKKEQIKRRSGELSLSPDGSPMTRSDSSSGLRRKKSMLSRQIDKSRAAESYTDGAERLVRSRSRSGSQSSEPVTFSNLQELETLVNDPANLVKRMSAESAQSARSNKGGEVPASEDMPILPVAPPGSGLRRSKHTTYRKGSLRKGERIPPSRRAIKTLSATEPDESPATTPAHAEDDQYGLNLARSNTDPIPPTPKLPENFSRPSRVPRGKSASADKADTTSGTSLNGIKQSPKPQQAQQPSLEQPVRATSPPEPTSTRPETPAPPSPAVPQIVKTPPAAEPQRPSTSSSTPAQANLPERTSSHERPISLPTHQSRPMHEPAGSQRSRRPGLMRQTASQTPAQTLNEMAAHPSPLPGNSTSTANLSFVPVLAEEKKSDKKSKKDKESEGTRKSSWSKLFGGDDKKEDEKKRSKLSKSNDKSHDTTRLDVLQNSIEGGRGRESLVIDRGDYKLEEERKKESSRKAGSGDKKEKESGFFSFLGGGKKKATERETTAKKHSSRNLSPEPPRRILRPDVDYNWTRFSLLEERAIYRMAHIKLANPRRSLYSQVLLSNFMYSYLAKVQQMHPQIQVPTQPGQRSSSQRQAQQRQKNQPDEFTQYQRYQEQQAALQQQQHQQQQQQQMQDDDYGDDLYDYEDDEHEDDRPHSRASQHTSHSNSNGYSYGDQYDSSREGGGNDMW